MTLFFLFNVVANINAAKPVTIAFSLTPPYTPFLSEYGSAGAINIQLSLIVNDSRMNNYPVKIQMILESRSSGIVMRTSEYAAIPPFYISGGVTEVFSGYDLNEHFKAINTQFSGIDKNSYIRTGRIPEGYYRLGFRVVDAQRSEVILSNTAYSQMGWFALNDPPQLNRPVNKEKIRVNESQNVLIEWYPRHLGGMNSAFSTSYQLEVFPMRIEGLNPNQVAMSEQPLFVDVTNQQRYRLTSDKFQLEPGVEYAYRVKAIGNDGSLSLFQNNGYSEVSSFIYGSLCAEPTFVQVEPTNSEASFNWNSDPLNTSFDLRIRKATDENTSWYVKESFTNDLIIDKILEEGEKYEFQVKSKCHNVASEYTPIQTFTTDRVIGESFECGSSEVDNITNTNPKPRLLIGETINYNEFPIRLIQISGENGTFSGKGRMKVPMLGNIQINMEFYNIKVNELNEVYDGEITSVYNPNSKLIIDDITDYFGEGNQYGNIIDGVDSSAFSLSTSLDLGSKVSITKGGDVKLKNKTIGTVSNIDGGTTITDKDGTIYVVQEGGGEAISVGTAGNTMGKGEYNKAQKSMNKLSKNIQVKFHNSGTWAFSDYDASYAGSPLVEDYEVLDNNYYVPWKFIPEGKYDKIVATLSGSIDTIDTEKIVFKTPTGTTFDSNWDGNSCELTITGARSHDGYELYAMYNANDSMSYSLGKISIASYPFVKHNVSIIPLEKDNNIDVDRIEEFVNEIYKPYAVSWSITKEKVFDDRSWDLNEDNKLEGIGTGVFSQYTPEMRALNNAYPNFAEDKIYLFYTDQSASGNSSLLGDMPLKSNIGYIFGKGASTASSSLTIAHELGHGAFQLHHPFSDKYGSNIQQRTTTNLMDYNQGKTLIKYQWDVMHDPQNMIFAWGQGEEEGQATFQPINYTYTFLFELVNKYAFRSEMVLVSHYDQINKNEVKGASIPLYFSEKDSKVWKNNEQDWIKDWKIRNMKSEAVLSKTAVISSIKSAKPNDAISKIILKQKHIYLTKYTINNKTYPIAIYGDGDAVKIENIFTKRQVSDMDSLSDRSNVKYIYCDDSFFSGYIIIAFYGEDRTTPSMILQVFPPYKLTTKYDKKDWLTYLGIYRESIEGKTIDKIFAENDELTVEEIQYVRKEIGKVEDPEKKKAYYLTLQGKVKYRNQRDNLSPIQDVDTIGGKNSFLIAQGDIGDIMCNVTSQAMCLEYLGVEAPCSTCPDSCNTSYDQLEDYLECVRVSNDFDHRGTSSARNDIASLFNICQEKKKYNSKFATKKDQLISYISDELASGNSVLMSVWPGCKGHIVRVQKIDANGIVVDDPYGRVNGVATGFMHRQNCNSGGYIKNDRTQPQNGQDNPWKWEDIKDVTIKYIEVYKQCK